jgi:hypothetical protein
MPDADAGIDGGLADGGLIGWWQPLWLTRCMLAPEPVKVSPRIPTNVQNTAARQH